MSNPEVHIAIFDTTARDGAQSLPDNHQFPEGSKVVIAEEIASLGVDVIEAGFPRTPSDGEEVQHVANSVGQTGYESHRWGGGELAIGTEIRTPVIAGLSRADLADIETTWSSVQNARIPRIHTFVSTSDFHRNNKFPGVSRDQLIVMGRDAIRYAKEISGNHPDASVEFSAEAASTTDMEYLERVVKMAADEGADVINLPDTVGERDPFWMFNFYAQAINWARSNNPDVTISAHNHNDLGNAVANTVALVRAAAEHAWTYGDTVDVQLETTVCGLGERAGNADVFAIAGNLAKFGDDFMVPIRWHFNPGRAVDVAERVMQLAGFEVDRQNPVVGCDTNVHRSGIHSDGIIKGGYRMYTPFDPRFWGHSVEAIHEDGRYQGKAGRQAATRHTT